MWLRARRSSMALGLAAVAAVAVGACALSAAANAYSPESDFLVRINALRERVGVPALEADPELDAVAEEWASEMASTGKLAHNPNLAAQITQSRKTVENVGFGRGVASLQSALEASPAHYQNLVDPDVRLAGIGVVEKNDVMWVAQNFKQPLGPPEPPSPPAPEPVEPPAVPSSLVFESSFEDHEGEAVAHLSSWGATHLEAVNSPVQSGERAQLVTVEEGETGGVWFELNVSPGLTYAQSIYVDLLALDPGARLELILEWFDEAANLIDYKPMPVVEVEGGLTFLQQVVDAPEGATTARFVVNVRGGGSYVLDDARLEAIAPASNAAS